LDTSGKYKQIDKPKKKKKQFDEFEEVLANMDEKPRHLSPPGYK